MYDLLLIKFKFLNFLNRLIFNIICTQIIDRSLESLLDDPERFLRSPWEDDTEDRGRYKLLTKVIHIIQN